MGWTEGVDHRPSGSRRLLHHQAGNERQWAERPGTFRGIKRKRKPLGWRALAPCVTCPHPETERLEAKQLRMCLLSKRELRY